MTFAESERQLAGRGSGGWRKYWYMWALKVAPQLKVLCAGGRGHQIKSATDKMSQQENTQLGGTSHAQTSEHVSEICEKCQSGDVEVWCDGLIVR